MRFIDNFNSMFFDVLVSALGLAGKIFPLAFTLYIVLYLSANLISLLIRWIRRHFIWNDDSED